MYLSPFPVRDRVVHKVICEAVEQLAFQGVYIILLNGIPYVGQSVDIARRLAEWGRLVEVEIIGVVRVIPGVTASRAAKFVREFVENFLLEGLKDGKLAVGNKIRPINPDTDAKRVLKHLKGLTPEQFKKAFSALDICDKT